MSNEMVLRNENNITHHKNYGSPLDLSPADFRKSLETRRDNRVVFVKWIREILKEDVDFGRIHVSKNCRQYEKGVARKGNNCTNESHWSKPSLWKSGAEKICGNLGIQATFPTLKRYEDLAIEGKEIDTIILTCELYNNSNQLVSEGAGARSVKKDYGDLNKSIKMAQKSSHIDATLRLGGLSEIFTQDIEDMVDMQQSPTTNGYNNGSKNSWVLDLWSKAKSHGVTKEEWTGVARANDIASTSNMSADQKQLFLTGINDLIDFKSQSTKVDVVEDVKDYYSEEESEIIKELPEEGEVY